MVIMNIKIISPQIFIHIDSIVFLAAVLKISFREKCFLKFQLSVSYRLKPSKLIHFKNTAKECTIFGKLIFPESDLVH